MMANDVKCYITQEQDGADAVVEPIAPASMPTVIQLCQDVLGSAADHARVKQQSGNSGNSGHSGKLAIGVAATLGMMIYYNWRERRLAKQDPEGHARLKRLKASMRNQELDKASVSGT